MRDHHTTVDSALDAQDALDPTIVLRQKKQPEHVHITQDQRTGDTIVTVREGLFQDEPFRVLRELLLILGRNYHPGLPEPVRERHAAETKRRLLAEVARMTPEDRARHDAQGEIIREMNARLDVLEATA